MKRNHIVLGSRGSILALAQTESIKALLEEKYPELIFSIQVIETEGDKDLKSHFGNSDKSLKSFFTKEIEKSLLDKNIDIAVHSMKDMPSVSPKGLICGAIPEREDVRDVLVSRERTLFPLFPKGAKIGTSSLRRSSNLQKMRGDLQILPLRGNIHTRLQKLEEGQYDAIVLAAAGLKRVGLEDKISEYCNPRLCPPAPAQGALYLQCREEDDFVKTLLASIHREEVAKVVEIEREFSRIFDGGCHTPMGCYSEVEGTQIRFFGRYYHEGKSYEAEVVAPLSQGIAIAQEVAQKIREQFSK